MNELPEDKAARLFSGIYGEHYSFQLHPTSVKRSSEHSIGIGLALGHELAKRGAKTIKDLWKEEYYSTLTLDQRVGLQYYEDLLERIPRAEVTELYSIGELLPLNNPCRSTLTIEAFVCSSRGW